MGLAAVAEVSRTLREAQMRRKTLRFEIQIGRNKNVNMHIFLRETQNSKHNLKKHVCTSLTFSEKASLSQLLGRQNVNSYVLLLACLD